MIPRSAAAAALLLAAAALAGCSGTTPVSAPAGGGQADVTNAFGRARLVETFAVDRATVAAWRYDALVGPYGHIYTFCVMTPEQTPYLVSLGSYDDTTQVAREMGEIRSDARVYHLDRAGAGSVATLGVFLTPPDYQATRAMVEAVASGRTVDAPPPTLGMALTHVLVARGANAAAVEMAGLCTTG